MKLTLNFFKKLSLIAVALLALSPPSAAQKTSAPAGCGGDIVFTDQNGKLWICYDMGPIVEGACYYECTRWD